MISSIGPYVRKHVIPERVSVSDAARRLGLSRVALSNFLNGHSRLSSELAHKFAEVFDADPADLLRRQAESEQIAPRSSDIHGANAYYSISSEDIVAWARRTNSRARFAVLVRRLINADTDGKAVIDFPGDDDAQTRGWDGFTEVAHPGRFVPAGRTGWELSVGTSLKGKADDDYDARLSLDSAERRDTTFIFVTAQRWPGGRRWADVHRARAEWRDVQVIDATRIVQWLERSPAELYWFAKEIGRDADGIRPIADCWWTWSQSTEPALSPRLFDEAVSAGQIRLLNWLASDEETPYVVTADSVDEALAALAILLGDDVNPHAAPAGRCFVADTPLALERLASTAPNAIIVTADRETEMAAAPYTRQHKLIVVRPAASIERNADLVIVPPTPDGFRAALTDMGIDFHRQGRLMEDCGLSATILRRQHAKIPALRTPAWAHDPALVSKLKPMLLAGAWNRSVEADRLFVAELAEGREYDAVENEDLGVLLALPDCPVWAIGNFRGVVSRKDIFFAMAPRLSPSDIERFLVVADLVLSEDDPALDLPPEERWTAKSMRLRREVSAAMRAAVGDFLTLLAVYGDQLLAPHVGKVAWRVDALVRKLLAEADTRGWLSQRSDLPLLAEASPESFLEAVETDLCRPAPHLLGLLRPVGQSPFDGPDRTGLLWGLETIAWDPRYYLRVGRVLARLASVPIDDNWANKPENSLESLISAWYPQTGAGLDARMAFVDWLLAHQPTVGWRVAMTQIEAGSRSATANHLPRWRIDVVPSTAADADTRAMQLHILGKLIEWPEPGVPEFGDLIRNASIFPLASQRRLWTRVEEWASTADDADRAALRELMRRSVLARRNNRGREAKSKLAERRREIFERLAPRDPVARNGWLFAEDWVAESGDSVWDDDFDYMAHEADIERRRKAAIAEILKAEGLDGIARLVAGGNAAHTVGRFLSAVASDGDRARADDPRIDNGSGSAREIVQALADRVRDGEDGRWTEVLHGFLFRLDDRDRILDNILAGATEQEALLLLRSSPFGPETWALLMRSRSELAYGYWSETVAYGAGLDDADLGFALERLLAAGRPITAYNMIMGRFDRIDGALLARIMKAVLEKSLDADRGVKMVYARVGKAIAALEAKGAATLNERANLEYHFVEVLERRGGLPNLERHIEAVPADFAQLVSAAFNRDDHSPDPETEGLSEDIRHRAFKKAYRALQGLQRVPGTRQDGSIDSDHLMRWTVDAREALAKIGRADIGDLILGQWLGRTPVDSDGIWPPRAVRELIEACAGETLIRGVANGLINNRGAVWRDVGGTQERTLAARYRGYRDALEADYPLTARMLEEVARSWDGQAAWHDEDDAVRQRLGRH